MPHKNKDEYLAYMKKYRADRTEVLREKVWEIAENYGCQLCPEQGGVVLDFHHYDSETKSFSIGDAVVKCYSWNNIVSEIQKCVVLCANCHRRVHAGMKTVTESMKCVCVHDDWLVLERFTYSGARAVGSPVCL